MKNENTGIVYSADVFKHFYFRGQKVFLSDFIVKRYDDTIILNERYSIEKKVNGEIFIKTPSYVGNFKEMPVEYKKDLNVFILEFYLNEIYSTDKSTFNDKTKNNNGSRPCSFWNTYYCVGVGLTQSAAIAESTASGDLINCEKLGPAEAVPFTGGTVWATAYCCNK